MLGNRKLTVTLARETLEGSVCKGEFYCPCCAAWLDELTEGLNENGCCTLGYADYITITISRKFPKTVLELRQGASSMVNSGMI
jgi:hypothetical protein